MDGWMLTYFGHEKQFSVGFHFPKKLWWGWFSSQKLLACFFVGLG
jgi:hypothetical protein